MLSGGCSGRGTAPPGSPARLEALRRVPRQAFPESGEHRAHALVEEGVEPVRVAVALVAVDAVLDELVPDRRRASPELFGDLQHGPAASGEELNPLAFVYGHLFHGFYVLPSPSAARASVTAMATG